MKVSILYIASREITYTRNQKMVKALETFSNVDVICFEDNVHTGGENKLRYLFRIFKVLIKYYTAIVTNYGKYDLLFIGFSAQLLYPFVKPFWRKKIITDLFVSLYDTICFDKKLFKPNSLRGRFIKWLDKICIEGSDIVLMDTKEHVDYIVSNFNQKEVKHIYVGSRKVDFKESFNSADIFHAVFTGSYIPLQGTINIVEAAKILETQPIKITMVGQGQEFQKVKELVAKYNLKGIELVGWLPFNELDSWISRADLILGIFGNTDKARRVIPNKIFEAASIGKPILTGESNAIKEIFTPNESIILCEMNNPKDLANKMIWAYKNKVLLSTIGGKGKKAFQSKASDSKIAKDLEYIIMGINL